jgi:hypothetical protein
MSHPIQTISLAIAPTVAQARQIILRAQSGARLLFILPEQADNFAHLARLRLLRQGADARGVEIALVTADADIRYFARLARIPTHTTEEKARQHWRWPKPEAPLPSPHKMRPTVIAPPPDAGIAMRPPTILTRPQGTVLLGEARVRPRRAWLAGLSVIIFMGLMVLALWGFTLYLLPQATVTLIPARQQLVSAVDLTAQVGLDEADYPHKMVPARVVQARVEGVGTTPTTGHDKAPVGKATGVVTFINRTSREVPVPEGVILRTTFGKSVRFRTLSEAVVPPGIGQRTEVEIEAVEPGLSGNVPALTINEIEGSLNIRLRVSNPYATRGGTVETVAIVIQADKDRLLNELSAQLQRQAYAKLAENLRQGETIPPETVNTYLLASTYDRFAGEPADVLGLQLQLLARGLAVDIASARELAERSLRETAPSDKFLLEETIRTGQPQFTLFQEDAVKFSLTASGEVLQPITAGDVRAILVGAPADQAAALLDEAFSLAQPPQITLTPSWLTHFPRLASRITVRVYKAAVK